MGSRSHYSTLKAFGAVVVYQTTTHSPNPWLYHAAPVASGTLLNLYLLYSSVPWIEGNENRVTPSGNSFGGFSKIEKTPEAMTHFLYLTNDFYI